MERPYFEVYGRRETFWYEEIYDEQTYQFKDFQEAKKVYGEMCGSENPFRLIYLYCIYLDKDGDEVKQRLSYVSWNMKCLNQHGLLN